ncbi:SAM-dependent methyltransferase [Mycobacterium montefiorense]|uniref:S-adenosyl-L-methionine-dependent methyltransferase n=1 Tax=Mycobacterium montefiorense TaxID=154654 RepID=A0AA37UV48_9MYCO|nr:SAM-dependent methyltransferase [Mycobacterium montefiorense]GBG36500.1 putative S-adenosyl-L-methionine-dependent methyltransferase [Mycobacterium montefiorense]GKU37238.1 putative S-adenosyl-L-methionine-dependent methyltransferase [Mycobacterium montefiorense]GKU43245.1 putative S-adenosyl-L-methionine-dependent methyltransferase [Mycobacterium montefiorense]GKU44020.1 putative S-adenosyl-L-methionine-dependent methyltransferase [Mycobacterium montefiorense]GKU53780.1 putative S-adenosyl
MTRTRDDSWDLKTGVGTTATMVAAARAVASRQTDPLICDPFAEILVRAVGLKLFTQLVDGTIGFEDLEVDWMPAYFGMRTRSLDGFVLDACRSGIRQAVILASGLDCRAHRLVWPAAMSIYEVDQSQVIEWKRSVLTHLGWPPAQGHHHVGIDLRQDWPTALRQAGFDDTQPTVWIIEGLLIGFLPPEAHNEIFDAITTLSASGSQLEADYVDSPRADALGESLSKHHATWNARDPEIDLRSLTFAGQYADPVAYLSERGWRTRSADLAGVFRAAGRSAPTADGFVELASFTRMLNGLRT